MKELTGRELVLLDMLDKASKANPVTRERMKNTFYVGDRTCRDMITNIRKQGHRVVTDSKNGGYWIAKSESEYRKFRPHYVAYAEDIFDTAEKMDNEGQVSMFELP